MISVRSSGYDHLVTTRPGHIDQPVHDDPGHLLITDRLSPPKKNHQGILIKGVAFVATVDKMIDFFKIWTGLQPHLSVQVCYREIDAFCQADFFYRCGSIPFNDGCADGLYQETHSRSITNPGGWIPCCQFLLNGVR